MRRPSGDSSTLPTERKRERSPLLKPWAPPNGAKASRPDEDKKKRPARSKVECNCRRIEFSPLNSRYTHSSGKVSYAAPGHAQFFTSSIGPSIRPSGDRHPWPAPDPRENGQPRG